MTDHSPVTTKPALDEATRSFVQRAISSGLLTIDQIKKVVASLMIESPKLSPSRIADGLVGADMLTRWQRDKLLAGKNGGFFLSSYRLLKPLGKGGMGVVYLGEHDVMKRLLALKILPPDAIENHRKIERFKEEARAAAQLDHPNIVRAYDFSQAGDKYFIAMEFVDGIDLQALIQRDGLMSIVSAMDVLRQATDGLAHAHGRGIIHRDIKPSNLMLRTDGVLKITDMGLARVGWSSGTESSNNRLMGTADYVAPEQAINSTQVDARADIYSLGCTFYFLLTGRPPFRGGTVAQRLAAHQTRPTPDLRELRPECPAAVSEMLMRMMAKRAEDRPRSAVELLAWIKRVFPQNDVPQQTAAEQPDDHACGTEILPANDTIVDESPFQGTLDDSSSSSDGLFGEELPDLDFDQLTGLEIEATASPNRSNAANATNHTASQSGHLRTEHHDAGTASVPSSQGRQILLGAGLAIAVLALVSVLGLVGHRILFPDQPKLPRFQRIDDGTGRIIYEVR